MSKIVIVVILIVVVLLFLRRGTENKKVALENKEIGSAFLLENKTDVEIKVTESGLQYVVLTTGDGTVRPGAKDKVKVHYHGTLIDGTIFDSSVDRGTPISFGLNQVIKGWTEGVQLMVVGDKYRFYIPSELGYGDRSAGKIPAG